MSINTLHREQSGYRNLIANWVAGSTSETLLPPDFKESKLLFQLKREGMTALVASQLDTISSNHLSASTRATLQQALHNAVVNEILQRREIARIVSALARAGIENLLLKGAPLAYTIYPHPWLRPALDTDLFIHDQDRNAARKVFEECGYHPATAVSGEVVSHQFSMLSQGPHGRKFNFDIHWKISNPQVFCNLLTLDEMLAQRLPVAELGTSAYGPSAVHALQHALIHRVAHFAPANRMIWLYDIHLLIQAFGERQWQEFVDSVIAKRIGTVCLDGLEAAMALFPMKRSTAIRDRANVLRLRIKPQEEVSTAAFVREQTDQISRFWSDLQRLDWPRKLRLIREHLFPPVAYMQQRYENDNAVALPYLYLSRVLRGGFKAIRNRFR